MTVTDSRPRSLAALSVRPLSPVIGAEIEGADLAEIDDAGVAAVRTALL